MEQKELENTIELLKSQISILQALVASKDALILELQKQQIDKQNPLVTPVPFTPYNPLIIGCDHSFPWMGTVPPSHCIKCGAAMHVPNFTLISSARGSING